MALPDLTDTDKMAHIGRMTVLRKARKDLGKKLRDLLIPMLNNLEGASGDGWDLSGVTELVDQINAITKAIKEIN